MYLIDGKAAAKKIRAELGLEVEALKDEKGVIPGLAVIIVGNDPASKVYVDKKHKACLQLGIHSEVYVMEETIEEGELLSKIDELNHRGDIHGILVQLPLPGHISEKKVIEKIDPDKDVDGFHPINAGKLLVGEETFLPCTPHGIIKLLELEGIEIEGKHAVVIGRSNIVGKPAASLLLQRNATVTTCHSKTKNLKEITQLADILVVALGSPNFVTADMVKPGAVVIDVGVNRLEKKLVGDVDFERVKEVAGYITPVPGGVGPMTITMLLYNTVMAAKKL